MLNRYYYTIFIVLFNKYRYYVHVKNSEMLKKMFFSMLQLNELLGYCNEINTYLQSTDLTDLQINGATEKLNVSLGKSLTAANKTQSSQFTERLRLSDVRRDESFIAFRNLMEASTHRRVESIVKTADQICRIIRSHSWTLYSRGYKVQSVKMASLIKELDLPLNQELISQLKASSWYTDMVEDNKAFNQLNEEKSLSANTEQDYDTEVVYKNVRIACEELFDAIEVLNRIAPNEKYTTMAQFINECTQKYMVVARSRNTKNENAKTEVTEA